MIGNVDEQVSTMVDAYRGKPQVLQQKYAMTKDMVTLLALQRIKSEQDAAKRQQSLNAQPNNSTVRQQREQEVAQNVGGVGQQQQQQQAARAQQMGIPQQAPQQAMPQQARPPVQGMAAGGIVGYADGGAVEDGLIPLAKDVAEWASNNKAEALSYGLLLLPGGLWAIGGARAAAAVLPKLAKLAGPAGKSAQSMLTNVSKKLGTKAKNVFTKEKKIGEQFTDIPGTANYGSPIAQDVTKRVISPKAIASAASVGAGGLGLAALEGGELAPSLLSANAAVPTPTPTTPTTPTAPVPREDMGGLGVLKPKDIPDSPPAMGAMPAGSSSTRTKSSVSGALGGGASTRQTLKGEDYKPDFSGITKIPSLDTEKLTAEERDALAAETERRLDRSGLKADRDRQMEGLAALRDEFGMTKEEREKAIGTERVMAGLGQGSMTGFARAGRAGAKKERARQRGILEGYLEKDRAITSDFRTRDVDIGKSAIRSVEDAVSSLAENQRAMVAAAATMKSAEMRAAVDASDRALKIDSANIANDLARVALEIEQVNSIKAESREKRNKLEETYRKGAEVLFEAIAEAQNNDSELQQLKRKAAQAANPKVRDELELQARLRTEAILVSVNKQAASSGLLGQIETAGNALGYDQAFRPGIDQLADPTGFDAILNKYGT